jgi:hypothetical protein
MSFKRKWLQSTVWTIPLFYALIAIVAGLTFPRIEARDWPGFASRMSVSVATAILTTPRALDSS